MDFAIADTCFLIDWSLWRRRDAIFELFRTIFVPETVMREVVSADTIEWITDALIKGVLSLFTETPDILEEARVLVEKSRSIPVLRGVDLPEAICLVVGRRRGYIVLTENRGALMIADILEEYRKVKVWRALEVIANLIKKRLLRTRDPTEIFNEYERETYHRFPRGELEVVIDELRREVGEVA